jgi:hypothetical protein
MARKPDKAHSDRRKAESDAHAAAWKKAVQDSKRHDEALAKEEKAGVVPPSKPEGEIK